MTRSASGKTFPVSTRLTSDPFEHLLALAHRLNADPAEIMRRFVVNGLEANPVSDEERRIARERARLKARGELPGLVVPTSPLANAAGASAKVTEIYLADEHDEVRSGGENGIRTRVSSFPTKLV